MFLWMVNSFSRCEKVWKDKQVVGQVKLFGLVVDLFRYSQKSQLWYSVCPPVLESLLVVDSVVVRNVKFLAHNNEVLVDLASELSWQI